MSLEEGTKFDDGKFAWHLADIGALKELLKVLMYGANKYEPFNWTKGMAYSRVYNAAMRHLTAWWMGETYDPETGINHLSHAFCNIMFLLAFQLRGMEEFDDRPRNTNTNIS